MDKAPQIIEQLAQPRLQAYIFDHENDDEKTLVLRQKEILGVPASAVADQIKGRRKAKEKLPTWYGTRGIIYPFSVNLEQSSSETTAAFRVSLFKERQWMTYSLCDLTGGFGVDTFFFSKIFKEVDYVEPDPIVSQIAQHNQKLLGATNVTCFQGTAADFLNKRRGTYDFFYIDPSRRDANQRKVFQLADCVPDVTALQVAWFERADFVMVKCSPLLDLQQGLRELRNVSEIFIVSVDNECKEVLFLCEKSFSQEAKVNCINLATIIGFGQFPQSRDDQFAFMLSDERKANAALSSPLTYLYEPNASIMKAGAFKTVADRYQLLKIHPNTHLYTSEKLLPHFPGRIYGIMENVRLDKALTQKFPGGQVNITTRNFPLTVDEIKKKTGLTDGGPLYLICFSGEKEKWAFISKRIK